MSTTRSTCLDASCSWRTSTLRRPSADAYKLAVAASLVNAEESLRVQKLCLGRKKLGGRQMGCIVIDGG